MLEISLHILDVINNSVRAGASLVEVTVNENPMQNLLSVTIKDDGCGMDKAFLKTVTDPFKTTRETRKVGMGLSLMKLAAESAGGKFLIWSDKGKGTEVFASFIYNHIDRQPLGDMAETISTVLSGNPAIDFLYTHVYNGKTFVLDTRKIKETLDGADITTPAVILWLTEYIRENLDELKKIG